MKVHITCPAYIAENFHGDFRCLYGSEGAYLVANYHYKLQVEHTLLSFSKGMKPGLPLGGPLPGPPGEDEPLGPCGGPAGPLAGFEGPPDGAPTDGGLAGEPSGTLVLHFGSSIKPLPVSCHDLFVGC